MNHGTAGYAPHSKLVFGWSPDGGGPQPATDGPLELADAGRLIRRAVRSVVRSARAGEAPNLRSLLAAHLSTGLDELAIVSSTWPSYEHVNVQAGIDAWLAAGHSYELVGIAGYQHHEFGLAELLSGAVGLEMFGVRPGNVARSDLPAGPSGLTRPCVQCGLYLVEEGERRTALLFRGPEPNSMHQNVTLQVVSDAPEHAAQVMAHVRQLALEENVFRGHVLSFEGDLFGGGGTLLTFHERPHLTPDQVILPAATLEAIERQVLGVALHRERLLSAGQHLKRGLLLYGPPGVGKTHTLRYLIGKLIGVTVVELTGSSLHLISEACSVARSLQPAVVVVEDVDLIAEDRGEFPGQHPLLFQLLNEMDGLAEDADVVFLLTTNRADLLEPALAARPGRVDQAVELALPDADGRRALFTLYSRELDVDTSRLDDLVASTDGVTASFLKELIRRACVFAAEADPSAPSLRVGTEHLEAALAELLDTRNAMTRVLLGGVPNASESSTWPGTEPRGEVPG
jgi:hypothetical protein